MPTPERLRKIKRVAAARQAGLILVFEDIHDPHNAEAVLRTADAFGVQEVFFIFEKGKPFNPRRIGRVSSSSANKWLDYRVFRSTAACLASLKRRKFTLVATALTDSAGSIFETRLERFPRLALLIGNEHQGLSEEALRRADRTVFVPMRGMVQSLNLSVTAAICLFEITRARVAAKKLRALSRPEQARLVRDFLRR